MGFVSKLNFPHILNTHSSSEVENCVCGCVEAFWRTVNLPGGLQNWTALSYRVHTVLGKYILWYLFQLSLQNVWNMCNSTLADICDCMSLFVWTCEERDLKEEANKSWHHINLREKESSCNHHLLWTPYTFPLVHWSHFSLKGQEKKFTGCW